jgi:hypothetical protein
MVTMVVATMALASASWAQSSGAGGGDSSGTSSSGGHHHHQKSGSASQDSKWRLPTIKKHEGPGGFPGADILITKL